MTGRNVNLKSIKKSDDKNQLFIDATILSLANHGYKGTTVRQIAKYAGVAPGLLTHYYSGKEVLIAESYKYLSKRFLDNFQASINSKSDNPLAALKVFFQKTLEPDNLGSNFLRVWLSFWSLTLTQPALKDAHRETYRQYIISIEDMLSRAFELNSQQVDAKKVKMLALGIYSLLDGLWIECCLDPDTFSPEEGLDIIYYFFESATGLTLDK